MFFGIPYLCDYPVFITLVGRMHNKAGGLFYKRMQECRNLIIAPWRLTFYFCCNEDSHSFFYYVLFYKVFSTSFILLTASALLLKAACSVSFSLKSRIFSH